MDQIETRAVADASLALTQSGDARTLKGSFPYGVAGRTNRDEVFMPFAFQRSLQTPNIHLFSEHDVFNHLAASRDKTLTVSESRGGIEFAASVPYAVETDGRGISIGFTARNGFLKTINGRNVRVITDADLHEISIVRDPAYPQTTLETRQTEREWIRNSIQFGNRIDCECQGGACNSVIFEINAFDSTIASGREILAVGGEGFNSPLASRRRGTLDMNIDPAARVLNVALNFPPEYTGLATAAAAIESIARVRENAVVAPVYIRPIIDPDLSEFTDENDGETRRFTDAHVRAFLVKGTPNATGLQPAEVRSLDRKRRRW